MLFQTSEFLVLLVVCLAGVALLRRAAWQHWLLTIASYVFYGWWDVRFLSLILVSSVIDYAAALGMGGVKLSRTQRLGMSGLMIVAFAVFLLPNWPALQHAADPSLSLVERLGAVFTTTWPGSWWAFAGLSVFGVLGPLLYGFYFTLPERGRRRAFMVTSLVGNLGLLGFFKYSMFVLGSIEGIAGRLGVGWEAPALSVLLPVGISFYTFQTMSYTIDVFRGHIPAERSFLRFSLFVAYFPQLVAGPILRPQQFMPSLDQPWVLRAAQFNSGLMLAMVGLFKKVLIADNVAPLVNTIFADPAGQSSLAIWLGTALFAIQIYCDFSGYTDIARGVSRMFGVEIPLNFNFPYFATSITDFWRRWHISLSTWLRDYLYIPLGGNRKGVGRTYFNLLATMILGGLWHGASWNFVIWGAYQGVLLCANRVLSAAIDPTPIGRFFQTVPGTVVKWAITLYFWMLGWLIFRMTDFNDLLVAARKFVVPDLRLSLGGIGRGQPATAAMAAAVFVLLHSAGFFADRAGRGRWGERVERWPWPARVAAVACVTVLLFYGWPAGQQAFIYFQF